MQKLSNIELAIEPGTVHTTYPPDSGDGWKILLSEVYAAAAFEPGDVVFFYVWGRDAPLQKAVVVATSWERSGRTGDYITIYKVRLYKKDGTLGRAWRWVYPGDIRRGFELLAQKEDAECGS